MTTNFYVPTSAIKGSRMVLPEDEVRHIRTVLRGEEGDEITVVDGVGGWYRVEMTHLTPDQGVGTILEQRENVGEPGVDVTVALGILKKRSRFETFVEKAVELGIGRIVPLRTRRTERESVRSDRLRKIMIAAMKQCRRSRLPALTGPQPLETVLADEESECRLVCHGREEAARIRTVLEDASSPESVLVLVGPEGGFAPSEVDAAREAGCVPVSLGARRLRAETAGLAGLHSVLEACRASWGRTERR